MRLGTLWCPTLSYPTLPYPSLPRPTPPCLVVSVAFLGRGGREKYVSLREQPLCILSLQTPTTPHRVSPCVSIGIIVYLRSTTTESRSLAMCLPTIRIPRSAISDPDDDMYLIRYEQETTGRDCVPINASTAGQVHNLR